MGRSRRRARTAAASASTGNAATRVPAPAPAPTRSASPAELRRTMAAYLAGAIVLAVLALLGTVMLLGTLGPWIVLAIVATGATALYRWATARLGGLALSDDDRLLQTMAGGLLVVAVAFTAVAAAILTVV